MPISCINNDQNIDRVYTKMSEHFPPDQNNTKLSNPVNLVNYFDQKSAKTECTNDELNLSYDHMYASHTENGETNLTDENCQSAESEVKFWKDWLILHLDLIQQQSDEILNKERTILILQQENEMLKERISCMERGAPFQPNKFYHNTNTYLDDNNLDMTQDSVPCDEDNKNCINLLTTLNGTATSPILPTIKLTNHSNESRQIAAANSPRIQEEEEQEIIQSKNYHHNNLSEANLLKTESEEVTDCTNNSTYGFTISSSSEFDPMRNLRMSIRRKRLSNSSAVSNNESVSVAEEKRAFRRFRKRRKRVVKDTQVLTTPEPYVTDAGEPHLGLPNITEIPVELASHTNLEVPRWRVKVYGSCYTMEGTENLDDEVYNKRHLRLETDERRRKRWDVQRIREQRVIDKLKQRQERTGSGSRIDEQNDPVQSLWPKLEDIKYLEVLEELPVSAFGCPIPKISPSEFSLPWESNSSLIVTKKVPGKRSTVRRKNSKR